MDDFFFRTIKSCSYSQSFILPSIVNPDAVEASFEDGVLTVELSKAKKSQT